MKFLVAAVALLVYAVANAHHTPEHQLGYPQFVSRKTHVYDVTVNVTSGVPGMHPQVAKSVMSMELKIYAKTPSELILSMDKVRVSDSLAGVGSAIDEVRMKEQQALKEKLRIPIKAYFEDGMVKSYTLDKRESLESQKIKRTILRNFELYLDQQILRDSQQGAWPATYNLTRYAPGGNYSSHYIVTSSPNANFPMDRNVFNISRSDNYETLPYPAHKTHHNFDQQGCPEVCKKNHVENRFAAGCPYGYQPHQSPMKKSFVQHHNLKTLSNGVTVVDMIRTKETHVADVYDQNMEVIIRTVIRFKQTLPTPIPEPSSEQQSYHKLNEWEEEITEKEINQYCRFPEPRESLNAVKTLLEKITAIVVEGEIDSEEAKQIGEYLILLQKNLIQLKEVDLKQVQQWIVSYDEFPRASETEKVKRQIWLDNLPLIGTPEAVSYITQLIIENVNKPNKFISVWDAKTMLEALPMNIQEPSGKTIVELSRLLEVMTKESTPAYQMFYSAAHICVSRVIRSLCAVPSSVPEEWDNAMPEEESPRNIQRILRKQSEEFSQRRCPKLIVKKYIQDVIQKLKATNDKAKRIIYIEVLARSGMEQALPILEKYINGHIQGLSQKYIDYVRTVAIHTLHNMVGKYPREVRNMLLPIYFNKTETPKIRTAAFSIFIRSYPTLGDLQHVAEQSWKEPSMEVASYVTTAMETLGNSSIPCQQLTADRIKKVLPQLKRFDGGLHHAKNHYWDMYDELRRYGWESRFEHTPSNESFFPSTLYGALGYNTDSLRETFFQWALTTQGLNSRNVYDNLLKAFGIAPPQDIPQGKEQEIFPQMNIASHESEPWRFTSFKKMFYSIYYYTFDEEETNKAEVWALLKEQFEHYFKRDSQGNMKGHLVKVFIPASYRSKAIAHSLPYPVEFEMRSPLLISLKAKFQKQPASRYSANYSVELTPSVYYSTLYTNQFLNLGDCKDVGVYFEKRIAATYPVRLQVAADIHTGRFNFSYSFPEMPKKVFSYNSEAGTYAGKKSVLELPAVHSRQTIKVLPAQFQKQFSYGMIGMPKVNAEIRTEDIQFGREELPRNPQEAIYYAMRHFLNAGWRRKSVEIQLTNDNVNWPSARTEVRMSFHLNNSHVEPSYFKQEDWTKGLKFEDRLAEHDTRSYAEEGRIISEKLHKSLPHTKHQLNVKVEQITERGRPLNAMELTATYAHTMGKFLQMVHVNATAHLAQMRKPMHVTADYAVAHINRPNEFKYTEEKYGKQQGLALWALSFEKVEPFRNPFIAAKAIFDYEPLDRVLKDEMVPTPSFEDFLPETHEECRKDVRNGKAQSVACLKAMGEHAIYNHMQMHAIWDQEFPEQVNETVQVLESGLRMVLFRHLNVQKKWKPESGIHLEATYIDKMTDEPVIDMVLRKPTETIKFQRVSAGWVKPVSSIEDMFFVRQFTNYTYPATCALMDSYVRTFDMKTFPMPEDVPTCSYVLSSHCTDRKKFAVLVKVQPQQGTKEVYIYLGANEIVLVPGTKGEYKLKYNKQYKTVKYMQPLELNKQEWIYAYTNWAVDGNTYIQIQAKKAGIKITYDGKNLKLQVAPWYKGELCGLCSEFNGEVYQEMRGVDRCLYSHPFDFAKSAIVGNCVDKKPQYPAICENTERNWPRQPRDPLSEEQEGHEPTMRRNVIFSDAEELCFSTKPVPVCQNSAPALESEPEMVDFHCLPKQDTNARKLVTESKRRILGELETKRVDRTESVDVAKMC